jgi:hypothetical protein
MPPPERIFDALRGRDFGYRHAQGWPPLGLPRGGDAADPAPANDRAALRAA